MPDATPVLALPLILAAQAQKHVTHNEALQRLDVLVQPVLAGLGSTVPPAEPAAGETHALGTGATGAWEGHDGELAGWAPGGWVFAAPRPGWRAWLAPAAELRVWDGAAWVAPALPPLDDLPGLGIGTAADAVNRLAVVSEAVLLSHAGDDIRLKLNKAAAGDTASLVFQSGWSGRAEMGLAGSDGFAVKVSADGAAWATALAVDAGTGVPDLAAGATVGGAVAYHRGNLVGSVAEVAGVPAGAVIEAGSTADGSFTRFADGTQICVSAGIASGAVTAAAGALYSSAPLAWTFPAAFAAGAPPAVSGSAGSALRWLAVEPADAAGAAFAVLAATASATGSTCRLMAVGRWF
jgi:hypothetical protein